MADLSKKPSQTPGTGFGAGPRKPTFQPRPSDEFFQRSMTNLSRRFSERDAQMSSVDPRLAAETRRVAMRDYERTRRRRLNLALAGAVGAIAIADIAYMLLSSETHPAPSSPSATASAQLPDSLPATPPQQATAASELAPSATTPAPPQQTPAANDKPTEPPMQQAVQKPEQKPVQKKAEEAPPPSPEPKSEAAIQSPAATPSSPPTADASRSAAQATPTSPTAPTTPPAAAATASAPDPGLLRHDEVREVQSRLRSFGFNAGPVDGSAGPMTEAAIVRYQQNRGQAATGRIDRQLLETLRQDPAPQVAPRNSPQYASGQQAPASTPRYASNDPLAAIRSAGERITQWLNSIVPPR